MSACWADGYEWCTTHDVPFIVVDGEQVCSTTYGITDVKDTLPYRLHERVLMMHDGSDCDHSECFEQADLDYVKETHMSYEEVSELLDMIETDQLDAMTFNELRARVSPKSPGPSWGPVFTPNWMDPSHTIELGEPR